MRSTTLEPASRSMPTISTLHIDLHVDEEQAIIWRRKGAVDRVRLDVGEVSLYLTPDALKRLLTEGLLAANSLELINRYPDPLPEI